MNNEDITKLKLFLEDHEKRITAIEKLLTKESKNVKKQMSIKEFLLTKKIENDVQKTLAIGYFLENYDNMNCFNVKDLEKGFKRVKEKPPKNINYKVVRNIQKGFMMEAEEKKEKLKAWVLTTLGEEFVENELR
ncbi:MAG: hypothetical protein ACTSP3_07475 [Candidatus Heimdallarchaeaceae archaeon]